MTLVESKITYEGLKQENLALDITRGKPAPEQLALNDAMLDISAEKLLAEQSGADIRNYGGLDGIPAGKALGSRLMNVPVNQLFVGGNSSLTLMYHAVLTGWLLGFGGESSWQQQAAAGKTIKFLCPVPGYDRHFAITESFGIEMINVPMGDTGPDMGVVERLLAADSAIKGIWCVPKYSNPTGQIYDAELTARLAKLAEIAAPDFRVFYDNAYAVHDLVSPAQELPSLWLACEAEGSEESVIQFASTSKITHAGSGVAFMAAGNDTLAQLSKHMSVVTIGADKVNQLRHAIWLNDKERLAEHMRQHAEILQPKFTIVLDKLSKGLGDEGDFGHWQSADGGYFISFYTKPGLAAQVVRLCAEAGVKLTPAGAAYPYGKDPEDTHIRLAPSFPSLDDLSKAMDVFVAAVKVATLSNQ